MVHFLRAIGKRHRMTSDLKRISRLAEESILSGKTRAQSGWLIRLKACEVR
jgi:hypothetical protein